jgi:SAM-dependent methyltransferase
VTANIGEIAHTGPSTQLGLRQPWVKPSSFGGKVLFWLPRETRKWLMKIVCSPATLVGLASRASAADPARNVTRLRHHEIGTLLERLHVDPKESMLDIGCGPGLLVDVLRTSYGYSNLRGCDWERPVECTFPFDLVDLNREILPYDDGAFGVVICNQVLEHLENPAAVLREISRVLAPGGLAVITVPNTTNLFERISILLLGESTRYGVLQPGDYSHITWFTDHILRSLLLRANLEPEGYARSHMMWGGYLLLSGRGGGPLWSYQRVLVARKATKV